MSEALPFETLPDHPEVLAANEATHRQLVEAVGMLMELVSIEGPLPQKPAGEAVAWAVGTLMLRLAETGVAFTARMAPERDPQRMRGDMAILLARTAGYLASGIPQMVLSRLLPVLDREMCECAGMPHGTPGPNDAPADLPLTPLRTKACNTTYVGDGCYDLPAYKSEDAISTWWSVSDQAKAAILAGIPLKITLFSPVWPPVRVEVDQL